MTLEAALCLPLFLFFCFCLLMPMRMMDRQRQIQGALEAVGEELSQYAYLDYWLKRDQEQVDGSGAAVSALTTAYASAAVMGRIDRDWIENPSFLGTRIGENDMIHLEMDYEMRFPFSVLGMERLPVRAVCDRRMWVGADGNRRKGGVGGNEGTELMVYVGKGGSRYHMRRDCHYLSNELTAVAPSEIEQLRNQDGKKYGPCARCGGRGNSGVLYVMPYGTSYHTAADCSAISAYVREVPLSEVAYLGACSYCSGGGK